MIKKIIKSKIYCFFMLIGLSFFVSLWVLAKYPVWKVNIGESVVCRIITLMFLVLFLLSDPIRRFLLDEDWIVGIKQIWLKIPSLYKKSFLIIFVGLNVVFLFNTVTYVIGDHDWGGVLYSREGLFEWYIVAGRYFYTVTNFFFLHGYTNLPVAQNLLKFTFLSLSAVLLCYYWKLPKSCFLYSLVGLLFVLQPYVLEPVCLWTNNFSYLYFFVLVGFICCDNVVRQNGWLKRVLLFMCSIISLWFSIGSYAPVVSTMAIVLLGRISIDFIFSDKNKVGIKNILYFHTLSISAVVSACLIHGGVCLYLKKMGIFSIGNYQNELLKFSDIPHRVVDILKNIPNYLLNYSLPFFPTSFTYLFAILFFMALVVSTIKCFEDSVSLKHKIVNSSFVIVMFFLTLLACFLPSFITKMNLLYTPRVDFFGIMCFHIFITVIVFSQRIKFVKNIALIICIVLIHISAVQDFYVQKVWKLSFDAEKGQWQRIISRIETTPGYTDTKDYRILMLGTTRAYSEFFYPERQYNTNSPKFCVLHSHIGSWITSPIMSFLVYTCHSKYGIWRQIAPEWNLDEYNKLIKVMSEEIKNAEVFPSSKSIAIKDDIMLVVLNEQALLQTQKLLEDRNEK